MSYSRAVTNVIRADSRYEAKLTTFATAFQLAPRSRQTPRLRRQGVDRSIYYRTGP